MSLTPQVPSHQPSTPTGTQLHGKAPLSPLDNKPTSSSTTLTKPSTTSTLLKKPTSNFTQLSKSISSSTLSSTLLRKSSTSFLQNITNHNIGSNTRALTRNLGSISSELSLSHKQPQGSLVQISNNNTREMGLVQFERSRKRYDGRGIVLPQDDANISIDKLLAQWEDKINRAEQEFEQEELAFERAQVRLLATPNHLSLRSLSPNASTRLLEKAKRIISTHNQIDNSSRLSPIKGHHHHHPL